MLCDRAIDEQLPVLWELIKIDLEYRWQDERAPQCLEFYLSQFPELGSVDAFPPHLIYEEVKIRSQFAGEVDLGGVAAAVSPSGRSAAGAVGNVGSADRHQPVAAHSGLAPVERGSGPGQATHRPTASR